MASIIGLAAVACLLFPVISMTDDLSAAPALLQSKQSRDWAGSSDMPALLPFATTDAPEPARLTMFPLMSSSVPPGESFPFSLNRRPPPLPSEQPLIS